MYDSKHLHIAIASDENYSRFVSSLILSISDHCNDFDKITVHLLSNCISKDSIERINQDFKDVRIHVKLHDISNIKNKLGRQITATIAITSYARLFLSDIIDETVDKILYLDTDIIINDDLKELWNINLKDNLVAGCLDIFEGHSAKTNVGLAKDDPYINAGVLLINLKEWRNKNLIKSFLNFINEKQGKVYHNDQGVINFVCNKKLKIIHPRYNVHSSLFSHPYDLICKFMSNYYNKMLYEEAITKPAIVHYTEGFYNRPWKKKCKHPLKNLYLEYSKRGSWSQIPLQKDDRKLNVKILSWIFLKLGYDKYRLYIKFLGIFKRK